MKRIIETIDFGEWMKNKRKSMGITQEAFGHMVLSNKNTVSRWETGDRYPTLDVLERIVHVLGAEIIIREKGDIEQ